MKAFYTLLRTTTISLLFGLMPISMCMATPTAASMGTYQFANQNIGSSGKFYKLGNGVYQYRKNSYSKDASLGLQLQNSVNSGTGFAIYVAEPTNVAVRVKKASTKDYIPSTITAYVITNGETKLTDMENGTNNNTSVSISLGSSAYASEPMNFPALSSNATADSTTATMSLPAGYYYIEGVCASKKAYIYSITLSACEAPSSVTVTTDKWWCSPGDDIRFVAHATGGSGTPRFQWQKYIGSDWSDIANETDSIYEISDCTISDGGSYRCVVSTGINCSEASAGYFIRVVTLEGKYMGGAWQSYPVVWQNETVGTVTLHLTESSTFLFKINDNDGKWFGSGENNYIIEHAEWDCGLNNHDIRLFTGPEGDYTITVDMTHGNDGNGSDYVRVAVDYPAVTHPSAGYAYFKKQDDWNNNYFVHWWEGSDVLSVGTDPRITMETTICGTDYIYFPVVDYYSNLVVKDVASGTPGHKTEDLSSVGSSEKYFDFTPGETWQAFPTKKIIFEAGGGIGFMPAINGICDGQDRTLPMCTFTSGTQMFDYWTADVDVTIDGVPFSAGRPIFDGYTLQSITENITLTAHWTDKLGDFLYLLGYCGVVNGQLKKGSSSSYSAWKYTPDLDIFEATEDISTSNKNTGNYYYRSTDITELNVQNNWSSSSSNKTIQVFKTSSGKTITFNLLGMEASSISYYLLPYDNNADAVQLIVNGVTETKNYEANKSGILHRFTYDSDTYTDEFKLKAGSKEAHGIILVNVPQVRIVFDSNGGSGSMAQQTMPRGQTQPLNANLFSKTGYRFKGWSTSPSGAGDLIEDEADYRLTHHTTLYAQWDEIKTTLITLNAMGAYNRYMTSAKAIVGDPLPEITNLPLRTGYIFEGYYDEPNGGGTQYYNGLGAGVRVWDKDVRETTLYANWVSACDLKPTLTLMTSMATIWDGKRVDMSLVNITCDFDTTDVHYSLQSAVCSQPLGGDCEFKYFDGQIHLIGTPAVGNTSTQIISVTLTMQNSCDPVSTYSISTQISVYKAGKKPKLAFIITGTKGGGFDEFSTDDKTNCNDLLTYLGNYYDVTCVNGYATKDYTTIENYYSNYDLMIVTDFLNTQEGYTDALGTMIDKKPILSYEAYVAKLKHWHIGSNPTDPHPATGIMKVLCAGHTIFGDADGITVFNTDAQNKSDTTITVLGSLSEKGLQGFVINEAPDFIFLATVHDAENNRDLIVCCERQLVFQARLIIYGINFNEMGNLTPQGKLVMRQMIDYLLTTDETDIADCSMVFDNGEGNNEYNHAAYVASGGTGQKGDGKWSTAANWYPGYNIVPTPYHGTRIIKECHVDVDNAHAGSVKVNKGKDKHGNILEGKLIIEPQGGLTVAGMVKKVNDTRYVSPVIIQAEDLFIEANETHNGAFVYGNKESVVNATVDYYSKGERANTPNPVWQYVGIPFRAGMSAITLYHKAWMCRWAEETTDALGGLWQWVDNYDVMLPFEGYCITQEAKKTYTFAGRLNPPVTTTILLDNRDEDGYAFAANSWTAPIKIQEMSDNDFINTEKSIYIYHTGTYEQWSTAGDPVNAHSGTVATLPGQYAVVPIHSAPYIAGADSVIPAMQGFFVKTTAAGAKLNLVYNRVVYDATNFKTSTQPMRAPKRASVWSTKPEVMRLIVSGASSGGDQVHLLSRSDFSEAYEDGWDGRKLDGDAGAPSLAIVKECGEMAVAAIASADERELSFRAGEDTKYTFRFEYEGEPIYLYDRDTRQATEIRTGNTYAFTANNKTPINRFLITTNPPSVPTGVESVQPSDVSLQKIMKNEQIYIIRGEEVYDITGRRLMPIEGKEGAR